MKFTLELTAKQAHILKVMMQNPQTEESKESDDVSNLRKAVFEALPLYEFLLEAMRYE